MFKVKSLGLIFLSFALGSSSLRIKSSELKVLSPEIEGSSQLAYETLDNFLVELKREKNSPTLNSTKWEKVGENKEKPLNKIIWESYKDCCLQKKLLIFFF